MTCEIKKAGYTIFGVGEMGIGNTTTSSAILSALTGLPARETVGKGGGITDQSFLRKKEIVDQAVLQYGFRGQPDLDVIDVIAKVGGFDLAAMTGAFLGAAINKLPVVIDGFISVVAALAAARMAPLAKEYMIASHVSKEQGYCHALAALDCLRCSTLNASGRRQRLSAGIPDYQRRMRDHEPYGHLRRS
jgi:nicotinate-nucleotide--dimethylbenzimidazole phosphoribosyltransferase